MLFRSSAKIAKLLFSSIPGENKLDRSVPSSLTPALCRAVADTMYLCASLPKETRSLSALFIPITGVLASAHGVSHTDRAVLALTLCRRWNGDFPPPHDSLRERLQKIVSCQEAWWAEYLGAVAEVVGEVYPSGMVPSPERIVSITAQWADNLGKKSIHQGVKVRLVVREGDVMVSPGVLNGLVESWEKVGKKKNKVGKFGVPVEVEIERV